MTDIVKDLRNSAQWNDCEGCGNAADEIERLREVLAFCVQFLECGDVHHEKKDYHRAVDPCPVMDRLVAATRAEIDL